MLRDHDREHEDMTIQMGKRKTPKPNQTKQRKRHTSCERLLRRDEQVTGQGNQLCEERRHLREVSFSKHAQAAEDHLVLHKIFFERKRGDHDGDDMLERNHSLIGENHAGHRRNGVVRSTSHRLWSNASCVKRIENGWEMRKYAGASKLAQQAQSERSVASNLRIFVSECVKKNGEQVLTEHHALMFQAFHNVSEYRNRSGALRDGALGFKQPQKWREQKIQAMGERCTESPCESSNRICGIFHQQVVDFRFRVFVNIIAILIFVTVGDNPSLVVVFAGLSLQEVDERIDELRASICILQHQRPSKAKKLIKSLQSHNKDSLVALLIKSRQNERCDRADRLLHDFIHANRNRQANSTLWLEEAGNAASNARETGDESFAEGSVRALLARAKQDKVMQRVRQEGKECMQGVLCEVCQQATGSNLLLNKREVQRKAKILLFIVIILQMGERRCGFVCLQHVV
eukprot:m.300854 g.300854  ORF g.300854 m.300854 type:complete len:460 (-) comp55217_c0_seq3:2007-3386(-)